jgi:hypothetical protein
MDLSFEPVALWLAVDYLDHSLSYSSLFCHHRISAVALLFELLFAFVAVSSLLLWFSRSPSFVTALITYLTLSELYLGCHRFVFVHLDPSRDVQISASFCYLVYRRFRTSSFTQILPLYILLFPSFIITATSSCYLVSRCCIVIYLVRFRRISRIHFRQIVLEFIITFSHRPIFSPLIAVTSGFASAHSSRCLAVSLSHCAESLSIRLPCVRAILDDVRVGIVLAEMGL